MVIISKNSKSSKKKIHTRRPKSKHFPTYYAVTGHPSASPPNCYFPGKINVKKEIRNKRWRGWYFQHFTCKQPIKKICLGEIKQRLNHSKLFDPRIEIQQIYRNIILINKTQRTKDSKYIYSNWIFSSPINKYFALRTCIRTWMCGSHLKNKVHQTEV